LYTRRECSRALGVERRDAAHDVEKHLLIVGLLCHVETMIQIAGMPPVGGLAAAAANGIANPTIMFGEVASNPLAGACNDEVARITHWLAARPARVQSSPSCRCWGKKSYSTRERCGLRLRSISRRSNSRKQPLERSTAGLAELFPARAITPPNEIPTTSA